MEKCNIREIMYRVISIKSMILVRFLKTVFSFAENGLFLSSIGAKMIINTMLNVIPMIQMKGVQGISFIASNVAITKITEEQ